MKVRINIPVKKVVHGVRKGIKLERQEFQKE